MGTNLSKRGKLFSPTVKTVGLHSILSMDNEKIKYLALTIFLFVLNISDLFLTLHVINYNGIMEINPLGYYLIHSNSIISLFIIKIVVPFGIVFYVLKYTLNFRIKCILWVVTVIYSAVNVNHLYLIYF